MCFLKRDWSLYDYWASIKPLSFPLIGSSIKTNQNFARIDNVGECTHTHTLIYIIDMINNANWGFREAEKSWADLLASAFTPVWRRGDKRKSTKTIMNWQRGLPWRQKGASHRLNPSNPSSFTPLSGPQQNMTSHSSFPWSNIPEKAIQRGVVANFASNFHSGTFLVCEWEFGFLAKIERWQINRPVCMFLEKVDRTNEICSNRYTAGVSWRCVESRKILRAGKW